MRPVHLLLSSAVICALAFFLDVSNNGTGGMFDNTFWLPRWAFSIPLIASLLVCIGSAAVVVKEKGFGRAWAAAIPTLVALVGLATYAPGFVLGCLLIAALPKRSQSHKVFYPQLGAVVTAAAFFVGLHARGYQIYGYTHVVTGVPPAGDNWDKVVEIRPPETFVLASGKEIDLTPYRLNAARSSLNKEALSHALFGVPLEDLYVKSSRTAHGDIRWKVRAGDRWHVCERYFFPDRVLGYHEEDILKRLSYSFSDLSQKGSSLTADPALVGRIKAIMDQDGELSLEEAHLFGIGSHEIAAFHAQIRPREGESAKWAGTFFLRKARDEMEWSAAEIFWTSRAYVLSNFQNVSEDSWTRFLEGELGDGGIQRF